MCITVTKDDSSGAAWTHSVSKCCHANHTAYCSTQWVHRRPVDVCTVGSSTHPCYLNFWNVLLSTLSHQLHTQCTHSGSVCSCYLCICISEARKSAFVLASLLASTKADFWRSWDKILLACMTAILSHACNLTYHLTDTESPCNKCDASGLYCSFFSEVSGNEQDPLGTTA